MEKTPTGAWDTKLSLEKGVLAKTTISRHDNIAVRELDDGYEIVISGVVKEPITIDHEGDGPVHSTIKIVLEENAHATIIEQPTKEFTHELNIKLKDRSTLNHALLQKGSYRGVKEAVAGRDASIYWFEIDQGRAVSRTKSRLGIGAHVTSASMYLCKEGESVDFGTSAEHEGNHSTSDLYTRGVLSKALSIYDGVLSIGKDAAKSEAHQSADALLLDAGSESKASPRLFINNNDVTCSHATSSTHVDEAKLFYLMSRGVPRKDAEQLLIKAFLWPVMQRLPQTFSKNISTIVEDRIMAYAEEYDE